MIGVAEHYQTRNTAPNAIMKHGETSISHDRTKNVNVIIAYTFVQRTMKMDVNFVNVSFVSLRKEVNRNESLYRVLPYQTRERI